MRRRPTFDQIAYTPDLGECLTPAQATALLTHIHDRAAELAARIEADLVRLGRSAHAINGPYEERTAERLVQSHATTQHMPWLTVGIVVMSDPMVGPKFCVAIQHWWDDDTLRVGWHPRLLPQPSWDR